MDQPCRLEPDDAGREAFVGKVPIGHEKAKNLRFFLTERAIKGLFADAALTDYRLYELFGEDE